MLKLGDWTKRRGKYQTFTVQICEPGKALDLGAWCLISETFLYLSGVIHLIGRCLIGEVLRYRFSAVVCTYELLNFPETKIVIFLPELYNLEDFW